MVYENYELRVFTSEWNLENKYIIFGDCKLLGDYANKIDIKYIVDNDSAKWGTLTNNDIKIKNPKELLTEDKDIKIIIANRWNTSISDISEQLTHIGFKIDVNFASYKKILSLWKWKYENKLMVSYTEYLVTTRCTLNCKNCILFIPLYKEAKNMTLDETIKDIDRYFAYIDEVLVFRILGGEPFLNPNLVEILKYICTNYRNQIGIFEIVTNGTVSTFNPLVLEVCKKYDIKIHISNYTKAVNYQDKLESFIKQLEEKRIDYENALPDKWSWKKINKISNGNALNKKELTNLFNDCHTHCRCLKNGRIYYCSTHASAIESDQFCGDHEDDYIDLQKKDKDILKAIRFDLGYIEKGYVSFCQECLGIGSRNVNFVIPGEQN